MWAFTTWEIGGNQPPQQQCFPLLCNICDCIKEIHEQARHPTQVNNLITDSETESYEDSSGLP